MNVNSPPNTAKIYQFPVKMSAGLRGSARDGKSTVDYRLQAASRDVVQQALHGWSESRHFLR